MTADVHALRHGYNLADLDVLARSALARGWARNTDRRLRYHLAWSGIAEALYASDAAPERADLVRAGWEALSGYLHDERRHWGMRHDGTVRPSYVLYWQEVARHSGSPEGAVVEREALWQIWYRLRDDERAALLALAVFGEYAAAAESLGLRYNTFCRHVRLGRLHFLRLWHEGETPSRPWGSDRRGSHVCRSGNDTVMGVLRRRARDKAAAS